MILHGLDIRSLRKGSVFWGRGVVCVPSCKEIQLYNFKTTLCRDNELVQCGLGMSLHV